MSAREGKAAIEELEAAPIPKAESVALCRDEIRFVCRWWK